MDNFPLAYFITFTCYGTRLPGDERGWVNRRDAVFGTPTAVSSPALLEISQMALRQSPYELDRVRRSIVLEAIKEVTAFRTWDLFAAHIRTNHVHVIIAAPTKPERVLTDLKARSTSRLNEHNVDPPDRNRWSKRGSTRYLWKPVNVEEAIRYVAYAQGDPLVRYLKPGILPEDNQQSPERQATG
jgi:REP element-mobilizing transposase RayT